MENERGTRCAAARLENCSGSAALGCTRNGGKGEKGRRVLGEKRARSSHVLRMRSLPHAQSDTTP